MHPVSYVPGRSRFRQLSSTLFYYLFKGFKKSLFFKFHFAINHLFCIAYAINLWSANKYEARIGLLVHESLWAYDWSIIEETWLSLITQLIIRSILILSDV